MNAGGVMSYGADPADGYGPPVYEVSSLTSVCQRLSLTGSMRKPGPVQSHYVENPHETYEKNSRVLGKQRISELSKIAKVKLGSGIELSGVESLERNLRSKYKSVSKL